MTTWFLKSTWISSITTQKTCQIKPKPWKDFPSSNLKQEKSLRSTKTNQTLGQKVSTNFPTWLLKNSHKETNLKTIKTAQPPSKILLWRHLMFPRRLTGEMKESYLTWKTKETVDHVGLSPPLELMRLIMRYNISWDTLRYSCFLSNSLLTAPMILIMMAVMAGFPQMHSLICITQEVTCSRDYAYKGVE